MSDTPLLGRKLATSCLHEAALVLARRILQRSVTDQSAELIIQICKPIIHRALSRQPIPKSPKLTDWVQLVSKRSDV